MSVGGGTCHSAQILEIVADQYVMFGEVLFQAHVYLHFREALGVAGIFAPGGRDACQRTSQIDVGTEADAFQPYLQMLVRLILALGRVSGETAPILFTCAAYFLPQLPTGILDQCMALPYHLYVISTSGTDMEAQLPLAYGTALVLIVIILLVNLLANALRKYFEKRVKTN